ncbi:hypothetical protein [Streptomyces sp. NPDC050564]|uniref:hypothetical protein n=1 Tax=Streptomyces sp. NPDC050564 TaxID=3365631 RepID=UPI003790CFD7
MTDDEELLTRVRELRRRGSGPKQIARALGVRPSVASVLVRRVAEVEQAVDDPVDRALVGCWLSPGWSEGLGLGDAPLAWQQSDPVSGTETASGGLAGVVVARRERASRVTVCGFLVDVHCLGVKNVHGPQAMGSGSLDAWRRDFFSAFDSPGVEAPLELAQHLVHGAVAFARGLGFEPCEEFAAAAVYLGEPAGPVPIEFGRDGVPFYVAGPYDDARSVVRTLNDAVGEGNYHYVLPMG